MIFFNIDTQCTKTNKRDLDLFYVCVCVFFPFILDIKFVGRTSRGHTGGRSHRIFHPPSFCGACLNFSREKDSAIPFPRRPWSRIMCTNDLIVLHPLSIFSFFSFFLFFSEKNPVCRGRTHVPTCQRVTRYLWATGRISRTRSVDRRTSFWPQAGLASDRLGLTILLPYSSAARTTSWICEPVK